MKLRTNYTKNDWYRFFLCWSIHLILFGAFILFSINYFLLPAFEILGLVGHQMQKDDYSLAKKVGVFLRQELDKKYDQQHIEIALPLVAFGVIIGSLLFFIRLMSLGWIVPEIICKKLKLYPKMSLVVIKNDRFWFRMRT